MKITGIDQVVENVLDRLVGLQQVWLIGICQEKDTGSNEIMLMGENINHAAQLDYISNAEEIIKRKVSYLIWETGDNKLIEQDYPERLLLFGGK